MLFRSNNILRLVSHKSSPLHLFHVHKESFELRRLRIRTLKADGKDIDTIGIPIHWGYEGVAKKGFIANTLTPSVGDANSQTPEFKSFLVNVEKV